MKFKRTPIIGLILISFVVACSGKTEVESSSNSLEWLKSATIYELNTRQFTPEGTFAAAQERLPELKDLGVRVIWLMPIHPIGELNRKGSLGSYYSIKDYKGINPEFGTEDDFRNFIEAAHRLGMKVIIDWVANHTSWDHPWTNSNPDWYTTDSTGSFVPPVADWSDVIALDYSNADMQEAMIDAMEYWVREFNIDGYRCDVADMVPVDFWNLVRTRLDAIKPVFLLAEAENPALHENAFNTGYAWEMHHTLNKVAKGASVHLIDSMITVTRTKFPTSYLMNFTSNHDENSWNGTEFERMGDGAAAFAVLTSTMEGIPLIYNGQEVGLNKRLAFFEKDTIQWVESPFFEMYRRLIALKTRNSALWNGSAGASMERLDFADNNRVYAFHRSNDVHSVIVVINFSNESSNVILDTKALPYSFVNIFDATEFDGTKGLNLTLSGWDYAVFERIN
jgi:cyclomaltodextrinase / maltogenic alpha-amylase / neopullulanase